MRRANTIRRPSASSPTNPAEVSAVINAAKRKPHQACAEAGIEAIGNDFRERDCLHRDHDAKQLFRVADNRLMSSCSSVLSLSTTEVRHVLRTQDLYFSRFSRQI